MYRRAYFVATWIYVLTCCGLVISCASAPEPDSGSGTIWGFVRLVPKTGAQAQGGGYGDRRLADVRRFDYSHTTFAVVFAPTAIEKAPEPAVLTIRVGSAGPKIEPLYAFANPVAGIRVTNQTNTVQMISMPRAGRLVRIAPGETARIGELVLGEASIHLLGLPNEGTPASPQIWVTDGLATEVGPSGRFALRGLEPGSHQLHAWHPRLPPSRAYSLELKRGSVRRVDIELGVDIGRPDMKESP